MLCICGLFAGLHWVCTGPVDFSGVGVKFKRQSLARQP